MLQCRLLVRGLSAPKTPDKEVRKITEKNRKNTHNRYMQIHLTQEEYEAIERKFRNSGLKSRSEFIRAMIFEGHIVQFSESELKEIHRLMTTIANNVNQIAVRVNSTGKIYDEDIAEIKEGINQIWQPLRYFQSQLLRLKR